MGLFKDNEFPVAEFLSKKGFYITSGLGILDHQIELVSEKVIKLFQS